jgi:hypothetical protein
MQKEWVLKGDAGGISVSFLINKLKEEKDQWIKSVISIVFEAFSGSCSASFLRSELKCLLETINHSHAGESKQFESLEGQFTLTISVSDLGGATVSGWVQVWGEPSAKLEFSFPTNLSYLEDSYKTLSCLLGSGFISEA